MKRTLYIICAIFLAVGVAVSAAAAFAIGNTQAFVERAVKVRGEVIDLQWSRGVSGSPDSGVYHPVVKYTTSGGEQRTFRSPNGSSPSAYRVGEAVDVLYDPADPSDARIASFWSLWLIEIVFAAIGAVITLASGGVIVAARVAVRRRSNLLRNGTPIETELQNVEINGGFRVNGRSPWRIVSKRLDPAESALHLYRSENLWFDPTPYIKSKHVTVFIDPRNPKRYCMDISFLPKPAN